MSFLNELRLTFWQIESFLKMYNRGEIYLYSIFGCQVINFKSFLYQFSIPEIAHFGEILGSNTATYCQIFLRSFTTSSIQAHSSLRIFEKLKLEIPNVFTFGPTFTAFSP